MVWPWYNSVKNLNRRRKREEEGKREKIHGSRKVGQRLACGLHTRVTAVPLTLRSQTSSRSRESYKHGEQSNLRTPGTLLFPNLATWAAARAGKEGRMSAGLLAGTGDQHHMSTENGHCSEWARTNCVRELSSLPEWPSSYGLVTPGSSAHSSSAATHASEARLIEQGFWSPVVQSQQI